MTSSPAIVNAPIRSVLGQMTAPMVLGMVAILTFNLVDTFFIGQLGTQALAAVSLTFPVTFIVTSLMMGLGAGLSAQVGHALGQGHGSAQDSDKAARLTTDGVGLAWLLVSALALLGAATITPLFHWLGATRALIALIHDYMLIWYLCVPLLVLPMVGNAAIRATGDTRTPSLIMAVAGLVNGLLDPLLIFGLGPVPAFGIGGAAMATAISWLIAMLVSFYLLREREKLLLAHFSPWATLKVHWQQLWQVALPAALSNMLTPLASTVLMAQLASFGAPVLAAYGAAARLEALLLIVMMALSSVLAPFVSQNMGAGKPERAGAALLGSMRFALALQLGLAAVMWFAAPWVAGLFSREPQVIALCTFYLQWVPLSYAGQGMVMLLAAALNGVRASKVALMLNGVRLFGLLLPAAWLGGYLGQAHGVYIGILIANLSAGLIAYTYARRYFPALLI
ncbi:MAG: MATE family efflux transporter [Aeromonas sp.]